MLLRQRPFDIAQASRSCAAVDEQLGLGDGLRERPPELLCVTDCSCRSPSEPRLAVRLDEGHVDPVHGRAAHKPDCAQCLVHACVLIARARLADPAWPKCPVRLKNPGQTASVPNQCSEPVFRTSVPNPCSEPMFRTSVPRPVSHVDRSRVDGARSPKQRQDPPGCIRDPRGVSIEATWPRGQGAWRRSGGTPRWMPARPLKSLLASLSAVSCPARPPVLFA